MHPSEKLNIPTTSVRPEQHLVAMENFEVNLDRGVLWCARRAEACSSVTLEQLHEQQALDELLVRGALPVKWKVLTSEHPKAFCLGGDLELFLDCIATQDHGRLLDYGLRAAHCIWMNASGFGPRRLGSIALVEGEAQGGGFEVALSCHWIVAAKTANFGFPESLFGVSPGMGAEPLLAARVGTELAGRMISSANRYTAEFLHEIGVVDLLIDPGCSDAAIQEIIAGSAAPASPGSIDRVRDLTYQHLVSGIEQWVNAMLGISLRHQRSMRYLLEAQRRRALRR